MEPQTAHNGTLQQLKNLFIRNVSLVAYDYLNLREGPNDRLTNLLPNIPKTFQI